MPLIPHPSSGAVFLPAIALLVCHVAAQYQTVASRQNESLFGDGAPGALPSGVPKSDKF